MLKKKEGKSCFKLGKCLHCVDFIRASKVQKVHSVFKHYPQGTSLALEDRTIDIYTNGGIQIYKIDSTEHADHYDFEDSDDIIDIFVLNVHSKFAL